VTGYDGQTGDREPMTGPMVLDGCSFAKPKTTPSSTDRCSDPEQYKSIETIGRVEFEGRSCYKVKVVRNSGKEDIEYFDVATGLLAGAR